MGLVERIKTLCDEKKTNFAEVERNIGISNGQIRRWNAATPGVDKLKLIADYFDVSIDYLLGRTEKKQPYYALTEKDERDIAKDLERILSDLDGENALAFHGEIMDDETKRLFAISLENSMRLAKEMAKKKFTPNKHRNE